MAVFTLVAIVLAVVPAHNVQASQPYSEKFAAYIAGSDALWHMTFDGINATASGITAVEAVRGVNWYNLTAISTSGWSSDFQVFGQDGYDLIPVPFLPTQGAFLTVGAFNYSEAFSAAAAFDSYLLTSFVSLSNSSSSYTFYSPLSFKSIMPSTMLRLIPTSMGGFASAVTSTALIASASPIVSLQGIREASGFGHNLTLGSITESALTNSSQPNILKYFGTTISSLGAANKSASSTVAIRFLDGVINSTDSFASWRNSGWSGAYSLSIAPGHSIKSLNVTVVQQPPILLAERVIDRGVLTLGQNVSISISLTNLSGNYTISTSAFADNWWETCGCFTLVGKTNSTIQSLTLGPGGSSTPTYLLQYNGSESEQLSIPATAIYYSFMIGSTEFEGRATTNPVILSLNTDEPVIYATVAPVGSPAASVGGTQSFVVVAKNVGTLTASSVVIAGQQKQGMVPGGSATATVTVGAESLLKTNFTRTYVVTYTTPSGQQVNVSTNEMPFIFSHSSMSIAFPRLSVSASVSNFASGITNLTLFLAASNKGSSSMSSFAAGAALPRGLTCGTVKGTGLMCSADELSLVDSTLKADETLNASIEFDLSSPPNYVFSPLFYTGMTAGFNLTGASNALAVPTGLRIEKQFASTSLFSGMSTEVTLRTINGGPFDIYNMTGQTSTDRFDAITSSYLPVNFTQELAPGKNVTVLYPVRANATYGTWTPSVVTVTLFFGGTQFSLSGPSQNVTVYRPVSVSIQTSPATLTEGKAFSMKLTLTNPSAVNVTEVHFILPIPSSMSLDHLQNASFSAGNLNVSISQLWPHGTYSANVTALATSGTTVPFSSGRLTFLFSEATLNGKLPQGGIVVGENVFTRYFVPMAIVLVALLATALYVRRIASATGSASRQ